MLPLSKYLGEFLGLFCMIAAAALMARKKRSLAAVFDMLDNPALLLVVSIFTIMFGLALVVGHNLWTGAPATIVVTVIAWASLAKGVALLVMPGPAMAKTYRAFALQPLFHLYLAGMFVLGAWLAYASFTG